MQEYKSQVQVKWECKYHVVIVPKYLRKALYGKLRRGIRQILRDLYPQRGIGLEEGKAIAARGVAESIFIIPVPKPHLTAQDAD